MVHTISLFMNTPKELWAAVVTHIHSNQLSEQVSYQWHERIGFWEEKFIVSQPHWATCKEEAYAIIHIFERVDYLSWVCKPIHMFTDHRNILNVFVLWTLHPYCTAPLFSKVHRWVTHLSFFNLFMDHIDGSQTMSAEALASWSKRISQCRCERRHRCFICFPKCTVKCINSYNNDRQNIRAAETWMTCWSEGRWGKYCSR